MKKYIMFVAMLAMPLFAWADAPGGVEQEYERCCKNDDVSNTFMYTRPILQNTATRQALWHNFIYEKNGDLKASFQASFVFQQSLSLQRTKYYFLPAELNQVLVSGDMVAGNLTTRHIRAEWLNLPATFQGTFTLNPKQTQAGILLECNQDLSTFGKNSFLEGSWLSFCIPVVIVENNMNIRQDTLATTTGNIINGRNGPTTIIEAFQQRDWWYAKINCTKMTQTKLADINMQLGKTFLARDNFVVACYTTLIIPTGNIQDAEFLFQPVAGNNGHFGIGTGVDFQCPITATTSPHELLFFLDFESIFFARNQQWRTFDLKGKPYSRYLQFVRRDDPTGELIPGVNVLTRHVQVHPYNLVDLSTGFRLKTNHMEIELNYSIWGHGDEKIVLLCDDECDKAPELYGIAGNQNPLASTCSLAPQNQRAACDPCGNILPATASKSTISCQATNDVECAQTLDIIIGECAGPALDANGNTQRVFVPVRKYDIDLESGARQSAFNHKFQIAIGFIHEGSSCDLLFGAGGYYDKPVKSGSLNLLGAWIKMGASF